MQPIASKQHGVKNHKELPLREVERQMVISNGGSVFITIIKVTRKTICLV